MSNKLCKLSFKICEKSTASTTISSDKLHFVNIIRHNYATNFYFITKVVMVTDFEFFQPVFQSPLTKGGFYVKFFKDIKGCDEDTRASKILREEPVW